MVQIKSNLQTILPRMAFAIVGFAFILSMICPITESAEAADTVANSANSGVAVKAKPALSVGLSSAFNMEIQPSTTGGTFAKQTANLTIATNNVTGYKAYLYTSNGKSTLDPKNPNNTSTINAVTSASTEANFPMNSWGYSLSKDAVSESTTYSAIPTTNDDNAKVIETESATASDNYNFTIGTLVDLSLPNDTYKNEAVISIVANPVILPISSLETMQEVEAANCDKSVVGETIQLTDVRDGKKYWVAKLADGHCWMTQNLALDLSTSVALTSELTNLPEGTSWTPPISTQKVGTSTPITGTDNTETRSWNFGEYVLKDPNSGSYSNTSNMANNPYLTDVSGMTPDYVATGTGTSLDAIDETNNKYDAHYLMGNYYQWNTATAGYGGSNVASTDVQYSICPKNWGLPKGNSTADGSWYYLLNQYSLASDSADNVNMLAETPLYLFRTGRVASSHIYDAGYYGRYWSSTAYASASYAYRLYFGTSSINPSSYDYRYGGNSVRCML